MKTSKPERHVLSKTTFMYGCQCPKRLWLNKFKPELKDEEDEHQTAIFQGGTDVGLLAQQLFPAGVNAKPETPYLYQQSVADTARYISEGHEIIYEAAFQFDGVLCAVDILVKKRNKWYAYEVKSSTGVKAPYLQDAALQYYVITNSGLQLADFFIVHLNNEYIRKEELDVQQLFSPVSVMQLLKEQQAFIEQKKVELKNVLKLKKAPDIETGEQCLKPYPCDFYGYCSKDLEEEEKDYGETYIDENAVSDFIKGLEYPLYFMDFETWMTAIPEQDGHWPYRQIPFQFSLHKQNKNKSIPEHKEYLAESRMASMHLFAVNLLRMLERNGSILVYNQTFEKRILRELKNDVPELADAIDAVLERIVDMMPLFRKHYRTPEMMGSYSIKNVLPALLPEFSYDELEIGNGTDASSAFYNLMDEVETGKINSIRNALLEYCKLDTLAMVKLLEKIKNRF